DILDEGYDVSVVIAHELPDSGFISRRLGDSYSVLCCSPAYVAKHGYASQPADLVKHRCLRLVNSVMSIDHWALQGPAGVEDVFLERAPFQVNTADAMTVALREGIGIGALPFYSALQSLKDGSLVRVLPDHQLYPLGVYALYPSRQFLDAKTRTWVEFLRDYLPNRLAADERMLQQCTAEARQD